MGIAVGDTIFTTEAQKRLAKIPGYSQFADGSQLTSNFRALSQIQPVELREQVLHAFTRSLATIYIVSVPLAFVGLVCSTLQFLHTLMLDLLTPLV